MSVDPPSSPALRASDADRDRVVELLRAALTDGRIDSAEFDERVEAALAARTHEALAPLTADLIAAPAGFSAALAPSLSATAAERPIEVLTLRERYGVVHRDGRWTLPRRLSLRTRYSDVMLNLTSAIRTGPELVIDMDVRGGKVELVLAPGMAVDANELAARYAKLAISARAPGDNSPETLLVRLVGRTRYVSISTRWI